MALQTLFAKTVLGGKLPNNAFGESVVIDVGGFELENSQVGALAGGDLANRANPNHPTPYRARQLMISHGGVAFSSLCINTHALVSNLAYFVTTGVIVVTSSTTNYVTPLTPQNLFDIFAENTIGTP